MASKPERQDHSAWALKVQLRQSLLAQLALPQPVILETHGGLGTLRASCYRDATGVVCEQDPARCRSLEQQRPGWEIVCGDSTALLRAGLASQTAFDLLDIDPHGQPWPTLEAFFWSVRCFPPVLGLVVTDGLRQHIQYQQGRNVHGMEPYRAKYGRYTWHNYLVICRERLGDIVARAGYRVTAWHGTYQGQLKTMTYYSAVLLRASP